ncbi:hypothetical protein KRP22_012208 [Phytophthora ramorum]|nr:hypothetical protein KRP22_14912 [Phytophthora ramorum]
MAATKATAPTMIGSKSSVSKPESAANSSCNQVVTHALPVGVVIAAISSSENSSLLWHGTVMAVYLSSTGHTFQAGSSALDAV